MAGESTKGESEPRDNTSEDETIKLKQEAHTR